jgi:DHA2 family multidrug resistance protein
MLYGLVQHQASLFAYVDNFRLLGYLALFCVPLALLFGGVKKQAGRIEPIGE